MFIENRRQDPTLLWQVFGSATGVTRYYPGGCQPLSTHPPLHPAHCPGACGVVDHSVGCGGSHSCQASWPWTSPSLPDPPPSFLPQPPHGEPPRKSTCMMSEGDPGEWARRSWAGTPLHSLPLPPAPLPPDIQDSEQGAASSIQFSFHTSLPLENGSHHPGRPPSCLCPPSTAQHSTPRD